jgi:hypothetical protein
MVTGRATLEPLAPDDTNVAGLHAILTLQTVQWDETYLSLGDDADALAQDGLRQAHSRR